MLRFSLLWADVVITLNLPEERLAEQLSSFLALPLHPDSVRHLKPDVLVTQIKNGYTIVTEQRTVTCCDSASLLLSLQSAIASLGLRQTKQHVVHAGAIKSGYGATLFCGPSYVGKSTLAFAAWSMGLEVMSDDRLILHPDDDCVTPLPKPIKPRMAKVPNWLLERSLVSGQDWVWGQLEGEAHLMLRRSLAGITPINEKTPIHRIYFVNRHEGSATSVRQVHPNEALTLWLNQMMMSAAPARLKTVRPLRRLLGQSSVFQMEIGNLDYIRAIQLMTEARRAPTL